MTGIVIYAIGILVVYLTEMNPGVEFAGLGTMIASVAFSPVIVVGLLIGWIWGKVANRNQVHRQ